MRAFPHALLHRVFHLAQGRCECQRHADRCGIALQEHAYGLLGEGGWFVGVWTRQEGGTLEAENCEALCPACYERVEREREAR